ncbi:MAG: ROK family protein [Fervidobacterium sp.]
MHAIALDMGGTFLKSAIVSNDGEIVQESFYKVPSFSNCSKNVIIENMLNTLRVQIKRAKELHMKIEGIGIGIPGPADYEKGILYIPPRLNKYQSIYGVSLKDEIIEHLNIGNVKFELDSFLFLRGENWLGVARNFSRVIGITLGTGLGSAFMINGKIVVDETITPPEGWIGGLAYKDGIVEDVISARWIVREYKKLKGIDKDFEVEEIAYFAERGDRICQRIFEELGENLSLVLEPIALRFRPDAIVFGGQISKSFKLFENTLKSGLSQLPFPIKIRTAKYIDLSSLYGAAYLIFSNYQDQSQNDSSHNQPT